MHSPMQLMHDVSQLGSCNYSNVHIHVQCMTIYTMYRHSVHVYKELHSLYILPETCHHRNLKAWLKICLNMLNWLLCMQIA